MNDTLDESKSGTDSRWIVPVVCLVLALLAAIMGAPSLHGEYSSGDDVQLVRDNVLVNHPSVAHAIKLFLIPAHRDLYQPVALLSFQFDFTIGDLLTFRGDPRIIHAHNIALHALNAVLVFLFLRLWTSRPVVAALAGLLMAVHPINVEAVAWMNGRMMLLSTALCLGGLMAFEYWARSTTAQGRRRWLVLSLVLFALTMMTKVRVELPGLLILLLIYRRVRPTRNWWLAWSAATAITLGFSIWAVYTTGESDMFEMAANEMRGPRLARAFQSLAWYFAHYLWPVGLGPWHPPQLEVTWAGGDTPGSITLVLLVLAAVGLSWRIGLTGVVGMLWFLGAIFSTLPLIATRAITAGERYAYLPGIGLHWIVAASLVWCGGWLALRTNRRAAVAAISVVVVAICVACIGIARTTCTYYRSSVRLAHRIVELYPETRDVWVDLAWAYVREGKYDDAIHYANEQFDHTEPDECLIYQAIAWSQFKLGNPAAAERFLLRARDANPGYSKVYFRLGKIYAEDGRLIEAEAMYVRCVELTPLYLPAQSALARLHLDLGRASEAESRYLLILATVNPYHPDSRYNLGDIYMTRGRYDLARKQYERLLSYMPEHLLAATNLGLCLQREGDTSAAFQAYSEALRRDPGLLVARLNRAALLAETGRGAEAVQDYRTVLQREPAQREALASLSEMLVDQYRVEELDALWSAALSAEPDAAELNAEWAWALCQTRDYASAIAPAERALARDAELISARAALGIVNYRSGDFGAAADLFETIAAAGASSTSDSIDRTMQALAELSSADPESPWPYYFTALLLGAQGRHEAASMGLAEFERRNSDPAWNERARRSLDALRESAAP